MGNHLKTINLEIEWIEERTTFYVISALHNIYLPSTLSCEMCHHSSNLLSNIDSRSMGTAPRMGGSSAKRNARNIDVSNAASVAGAAGGSLYGAVPFPLTVVSGVCDGASMPWILVPCNLRDPGARSTEHSTVWHRSRRRYRSASSDVHAAAAPVVSGV